jgi:hypothetical protein
MSRQPGAGVAFAAALIVPDPVTEMSLSVACQRSHHRILIKQGSGLDLLRGPQEPIYVSQVQNDATARHRNECGSRAPRHCRDCRVGNEARLPRPEWRLSRVTAADAGLRRSHRSGRHPPRGRRRCRVAARCPRRLVSRSPLPGPLRGSADRTSCRAGCPP